MSLTVKPRFGYDASGYYGGGYGYGTQTQQASNAYPGYGYGQQTSYASAYPGYTQQQPQPNPYGASNYGYASPVMPSYQPPAQQFAPQPQANQGPSLDELMKALGGGSKPSAASVMESAPPPVEAVAPPPPTMDLATNGNGDAPVVKQGMSTGATVALAAVTAAAGGIGGYLWGSKKGGDADEAEKAKSAGTAQIASKDERFKVLYLEAIKSGDEDKKTDMEFKGTKISGETKLKYKIVGSSEVQRTVRLDPKMDGGKAVMESGGPVVEDDSNTVSGKKEVAGSARYYSGTGSNALEFHYTGSKKKDEVPSDEALPLISRDAQGRPQFDNKTLAVMVPVKYVKTGTETADYSDDELRLLAQRAIDKWSTTNPIPVHAPENTVLSQNHKGYKVTLQDKKTADNVDHFDVDLNAATPVYEVQKQVIKGKAKADGTYDTELTGSGHFVDISGKDVTDSPDLVVLKSHKDDGSARLDTFIGDTTKEAAFKKALVNKFLANTGRTTIP